MLFMRFVHSCKERHLHEMRHLRKHNGLFLSLNLFYASFIPGLQNIAADAVKERLTDAKIHKLVDGAVLFETETSYDKLNFFCFNNIFAVIDIMEEARGAGALENHIKSVLCGGFGGESVIAANSRNIRTFRIVFSRENTPAAVDERLRLQAEKLIKSLSGLKVNRSLPDTEFWFLCRSEGFSVFMKRLTLRPSWEKTLHKGELPSPLAWTMCRLAGPVHGGTVIDPFCGYGSIADAALKHFHIGKFIACDNDKKSADYTASRFQNRKKKDFILYRCDFAELPLLTGENSVDAVITDPPWGQYREISDDNFYVKMFEVFGKLLKDGGRAVVLYATGGGFLQALPGCFKPENSIPVLLSGRKAVIYQLIKQ